MIIKATDERFHPLPRFQEEIEGEVASDTLDLLRGSKYKDKEIDVALLPRLAPQEAPM